MPQEQFGKDFTPIPLTDYKRYPVEVMRARAKDYHEHIKCRHTVRDFSDEPVPRDIIEQCLKTAGTAPNGANHQPWHFSVVGNASIKKKIREAAEEEEKAFYDDRAGQEWLEALVPLGTGSNKPFLEKAPWLICIFGQRKSIGTDGKSYKNYYVPESVSIATGFLITALHNAGLATLTHTPAPMGFLSEICKRPTTDKPYILLVVGYPDKDASIPMHAKLKKPIEEIATFLE